MATYTVVKGDTLYGIAKAKLGSGSKYQELAKWNNISNPNLIYIGQVLQLQAPSSSSGSSNTTNSNKPTITAIGRVSNADNTLFATWNWSKSHTASYKVQWLYDTGNGVWFVGTDTSNSVDEHAPELSRQSTYSIPNNAVRVRFKVKPISETYKKNDKDVYYWEAQWATGLIENTDVPDTPDSPSVEINGYKLTAYYNNLTIDADSIEFHVYKNDEKKVYTGIATITPTKRASYEWTVAAGTSYKVKCRAIKTKSSSKKLYSGWSSFSTEVLGPVGTPTKITTIRGASETSVYLEWSAVSNAESYRIEYTTEKDKFDITDVQSVEVSSVNGNPPLTKREITGLESGLEYFFRVKAIRGESASGWTAIASIVIGKDPAAPTTWSSTTTAVVGEQVILYWVHNSEDGSVETFAQIELYVDKQKVPIADIENPNSEEGEYETRYYVLDTSANSALYKDGAVIEWRVRTAGITRSWGEWSTTRTIEVFASPTLELSLTDDTGVDIEVLESFPANVRAVPWPDTQTPIGYHLTVIANESYETVDNLGNVKMVKMGDTVFSKYFDNHQDLSETLSANNIDLENGVGYVLSCIVSMNSGLTAESSLSFEVSWTDEFYTPNAEIAIDSDTMVAYIRPYCEETINKTYAVTKGASWSTSELTSEIDISPRYTESGEVVYVGTRDGTNLTYFCMAYVNSSGLALDTPECRLVTYDSVSDIFTKSYVIQRSDVSDFYIPGTSALLTIGKVLTTGGNVLSNPYYATEETLRMVEDISLSVYRREFDGSFVELATGLDNVRGTTITDPHPALDFARYRIVAKSNSTGAIGYYDMPGYPVGGKAVIIQWDEDWTSFETSEEAPMEQPAWAGSMLVLPYNIDVSDSTSPDVSHIEYIGRSHPVSYHGTQIGHSSVWNMVVPKDDEETIYALRRLSRWLGNVYVREPSGTGYWATVTVSINIKHRELTVPVTLNVIRVEGGV